MPAFLGLKEKQGDHHEQVRIYGVCGPANAGLVEVLRQELRACRRQQPDKLSAGSGCGHQAGGGHVVKPGREGQRLFRCVREHVPQALDQLEQGQVGIAQLGVQIRRDPNGRPVMEFISHAGDRSARSSVAGRQDRTNAPTHQRTNGQRATGN